MLPWNDRAGRFSALKATTLALTVAPAAWLAIQAGAGWLGSKPLTEAIHQSGDWAVRLLLVSLAVTPLRQIAGWGRLILVRRMLGLSALLYTLLHLALYVWLEAFDLGKVASEIALRTYLTIGFAALLGLAALGATSTDRMISRLGAERWNRLHSIVYALAVLAMVHFAMQKKLDVYEPALMAGFLFWLLAYRALRRTAPGAGPFALAGLAIVAALATAAMEAGWYGGMTAVSGWRVLAANLDFSYQIRPAWWVLGAAMAVAALAAVRPQPDMQGRVRRRSSPEAAAASS